MTLMAPKEKETHMTANVCESSKVALCVARRVVAKP